MATIKGLTLEVAGNTTPLQKALSGVNKTSKDLQSELRQVENLLKLDPTNTELLAQKQKILGDSINNTSDKLKTLKTAAEQAQEKLAKGEIGEEQFRALQREVIKTESQLEKLKNTSQKTGEKFDLLGTKADKINGFMKKASLGVAAVGAGLVGMAYKAGQAADDINTLAKQTGLSTDQIQKFQYATDLIDVPLETLTGSMAKLTKNMATAQSGTGDAAKAFSSLGVGITNQDGSLRDNQAVFTETIKKLGEMENETQRDAYAMQIFGKSAQDLNPLILGGADALQQLGDQAEDAGLIMSQDALDGANAFNDGIDTMKATASQAFGVIGGEIAETLLPKMQELVKKVSELVGWVLDNKDQIISALAAIAAGVAAFNAVVMIQKMVEVFGAWKKATEGMTLATKALNLAQKANPIALIVTLIIGLIAYLVVLWKTNEDFRNKVIAIWTAIKDGIGSAIDGVVSFFTETIPNAFMNGVKALYNLNVKYQAWANSLVEKFLAWFAKIPEIGKNIVKGIYKGVTASTKWLFAKLKEWCGSVLKGVKAFFGIHSPSTVFRDEVGKNIVLGIDQGMQEEEKTVIKTAGELSKHILSEATSWVDDKKFYNQLALKDELAFWEDLKSMSGLQASEISDIDKKIYTAKQTLSEESLKEQEEFENSVKSRADALKGFAGIFDDITNDTKVSGQQLLKNLENQVDTFANWQNSLQELSARGISGGLLEELQNAGPSAAKELKALTALSDEELTKYADLFAEKSALATNQALYELSPLQQAIQTTASSLSAMSGEIANLGGNISYSLADTTDYSKEDTQETMIQKIAEAVQAAVTQSIMNGLTYVGDSIFDAIPKQADFNVDSKKLAKITWGAYSDEGDRRSRIYAPSRAEIAAIALSVMPKPLT